MKLKKFNQLNESSGQMVKVTKSRWGGEIKSTIELDISVYLKKGDERTEITQEEAITMVLRQLDNLSGSNDGSELLANVGEKQIKFK